MQYQIKNVDAMETKFKMNQKVIVKCGKVYYDGIIVDVRRNLRTLKIEYSVDCYKYGTVWAITGVPTSAITPKNQMI